MAEVRLWIRKQLSLILLVLVVGGFLMIMIELLLTEHLAGAQQVGFFAALFGFSLAIHSMIARPKTQMYLAVFFLILALFGLVGVFEHYGVRKAKEILSMVQSTTLNSASATSGEGRVRVISPPLLAPLSLSGLSLLGVAALLAGHEANPKDA